jgi:hypothetical protein
MDEALARRIAGEHGIEPRYIIGGQALYRIEDFSEVVSLLRPAGEPVELLRPARSGESVEEVLVRPVDRGKES